MSEEWFDILDENYRVIGKALRSVCHANPGLMHGAVHVVVFDHAGRIFLQKRSAKKDLHPGCWDTSVGGHRQPGEHPRNAAARELGEELGVRVDILNEAYSYVWRSACETELINAFAVIHDGPFTLCPDEISEGRFWSIDEISRAIQSSNPGFTPQFHSEFPRMKRWYAEFSNQLSLRQ